MTPSRALVCPELLARLEREILRRRDGRILRVGIDGVDGAGKTTLADALAATLTATAIPVVRASVDGFHHPRAVRYRLGRDSPEGFFRDSYDYPAMHRALLDPLSPGGSLRYRAAVFDHRTDRPVVAPEQRAEAGSVLVVDGIFLHRPELRRYWDLSVFLDVRFEVSIPRGAQRGEGSADPLAPENRRYVEGQRLYLQECDPKAHATIVVGYDDPAAPLILPEQT
ncbi:MAG TPA: uridine kinase [Methylomirabilota bacterium]